MSGDANRKAPGPMGWRVGRSLKRTIYHDNVFMGIMETAELARMIVTMLNEAGPGWDAGLFGDHLVSSPAPEFHRHLYATTACTDPECSIKGAVPVEARQFHQRSGASLRGDRCVCGDQWLIRSGRCVSQLPAPEWR